MPELPEVEVTRLGLAALINQKPTAAVLYRSDLRRPLPPLPTLLRGSQLVEIGRRSKYLLFQFARPAPCHDTRSLQSTLLIHLGMSGKLMLLPRAGAAAASHHDHVDLVFERALLRYNDPRRFGSFDWVDDSRTLAEHPLLARLGPEPLAKTWGVDQLAHALASRRSAIKPCLMNAEVVVGVGNIYASESLFGAGISPLRPADSLNRREITALHRAIRTTLQAAIAAGGSSLKDFTHVDGGFGCFQTHNAVYERGGEPCRRRGCRGTIVHLRQSGRSSYYCPVCQR